MGRGCGCGEGGARQNLIETQHCIHKSARASLRLRLSRSHHAALSTRPPSPSPPPPPPLPSRGELAQRQAPTILREGAARAMPAAPRPGISTLKAGESPAAPQYPGFQGTRGNIMSGSRECAGLQRGLIRVGIRQEMPCACCVVFVCADSSKYDIPPPSKTRMRVPAWRVREGARRGRRAGRFQTPRRRRRRRPPRPRRRRRGVARRAACPHRTMLPR